MAALQSNLTVVCTLQYLVSYNKEVEKCQLIDNDLHWFSLAHRSGLIGIMLHERLFIMFAI